MGLTGSLLLAGCGLATSLPLLLFASGLRSIPLTLVGILQYITPTLQLLLGVVVFKEPFSPIQLTGFAMIWFALGLFSFAAYRSQPRIAPA
jgi:chloramphenicol-sensitive protein RarD